LITLRDGFGAWGDVPALLRSEIFKWLPRGDVFLCRAGPGRKCESGWLAGCATCNTKMWAVKLKGVNKNVYHASALEAHFEHDARHQLDVSASDPAHRDRLTVVTSASSLTHSLPSCNPSSHVCVAYMCACMCARHVCCSVLGRSLSSTHAETHACNGLHLRVRTHVHALAIPLCDDRCATLILSPRRHSCSDAHPPPRRSQPRSLGTAVPCAQPRCHQASPLTLPGATVLHVCQRSAQNSLTRVQRVRVRKSSAHAATTTNCSRQASEATTSATVKQVARVPRGRAESGRVKVLLGVTRNVSMLNP
jgi:hypothetical protein